MNQMNFPFAIARRNIYPQLFGISAICATVGFFLLPNSLQSPGLLLSLVGGIAAFVHFLYVQHSRDIDRFIKLFSDFNARYDRLNGLLNTIANRDASILPSQEEIQKLNDYFNLCAEEYLYFKSGYIDREVWTSWRNGMRKFALNPEIRRLWLSELEQGSYYGFKPELILPE